MIHFARIQLRVGNAVRQPLCMTAALAELCLFATSDNFLVTCPGCLKMADIARETSAREVFQARFAPRTSSAAARSRR